MCAAWTALSGASAFAQAAGDATETPPAYWGEPSALTRAIEFYDKRTQTVGEPSAPKDGFYPELGNMITGSGWISAGPGYRHGVAGGGRLWISGALSVRLYNLAQARIEFPRVGSDRLLVGAQTIYRDSLQVNYFGVGEHALEQNRSGYRLRATEISTYSTWHAGPVSISGRASWLPAIDIARMAGWGPSYPDTQTIFDDRSAPGLGDEPTYVAADAEAAVDTRDHPSHPRSGGWYVARWAGYSDRDRGKYSFQRLEAEASQYLPLSPRWTLAVHGWVVGTPSAADHVVPFYLLPSLGGKNTLRGFADYRFHDRAMDVFNVESRWAVMPHVDVAAFADAGHVAPRVSDLWSSNAKASIGAGVRVHNVRSTLGRLDIARSNEGWHLMFKLTEVFKRGTPDSGRSAIIPFVP